MTRLGLPDFRWLMHVVGVVAMLFMPLVAAGQASQSLEVTPQTPVVQPLACVEGVTVPAQVTVEDFPDDGMTYTVTQPGADGYWTVLVTADAGYVFGEVDSTVWTMNEDGALAATGQAGGEPCPTSEPTLEPTATEVSTETALPTGTTEPTEPSLPTIEETLTPELTPSPEASLPASTSEPETQRSARLAEDMPAPAPFLLSKVDPNGNPVEGAVFSVQDCVYVEAASVFDCTYVGHLTLNHDASFVIDQVEMQPSVSTIVTQRLVFTEIHTPRGYDTLDGPITVYNICGEWRTGESCDSPPVGSTLVIENHPSESDEPIVHRSAPRLLKVNENGALINGAYVDAEWCAPTDDDATMTCSVVSVDYRSGEPLFLN